MRTGYRHQRKQWFAALEVASRGCCRSRVLPGIVRRRRRCERNQTCQAQLPIVMVADPQGLPRGALKSVDTLVDKSDGPHFQWAAVHFLLTTKVDTDSLPAGSRTTPESRLGEPNKARQPILREGLGSHLKRAVLL